MITPEEHYRRALKKIHRLLKPGTFYVSSVTWLEIAKIVERALAKKWGKS